MRFRFGECVLDSDTRELFVRGSPVHLSPKGLQFLELMLESRPRALSKSELHDSVWPGVFVSDVSLAKIVSKIREAIGDRDETAPIIRTVHAYGYAFTAAIEELPARGAGDDGPRHAVCWLFCGSRDFPLPDGEHIIGRDPGASVCLDSPKVSRRHAKIVVKGTTATLEDLGSKNGSFVGGARITGPTPLKPGDEARIGPFRLTFRTDAGSGSTLSEGR